MFFLEYRRAGCWGHVYIDDIDEVVRFIEFLQKFADDTKLGNTVTSPEDRGRLLARHNNAEHAYRYFMGGQQLEVTVEERDLGVNVVKAARTGFRHK